MPRLCPCGKDISSRPRQAKFCKECAQLRKKQSTRLAISRYRKTDNGRKVHREINERYRQSDKGKIAVSKYARSDKGKAANKRAHLKRDPQAHNVASRRDYHKHKAKRLISARRWAREHPEEYKATIQRWGKQNPDKLRGYLHQYRARKLNQLGVVSTDIVAKLKSEQGERCNVCGKDLELGFHVDHIIPISVGGLHDDSNLQLLCPKCNLIKGNSLDPKWCPPERREELYG